MAEGDAGKRGNRAYFSLTLTYPSDQQYRPCCFCAHVVGRTKGARSNISERGH